MVEDLNKTQLVLLTLLVSFVTSIGTGVITFSLLQEARPVVTQTINRVVEQTIQQVTPQNAGSGKVTTVVVKEGDEIVSSISKNAGSIVRISNNDATPGADQFYSIGVVLSKDGLIIAPARDTFSSTFLYYAVFADQSNQNIRYLGQDKTGSVDFFKVTPNPGEKAFDKGVPAVFSSEDAKLGQTVILIEGKAKNIVSIGHISDFVYADISDPKTKNGMETDITPKGDATGGPLLNLSGEILGFRKFPASVANDQIYLLASSLKDAIAEYLKK
jgi:hypothetical protein